MPVPLEPLSDFLAAFAVVRELVSGMEGRVWAESEVGRGSRSVIELPGRHRRRSFPDHRHPPVLASQWQNPSKPSSRHRLKAGGLGLNLTAADYVVLLDPWWNPAVEAQAIDRAHRIGQTRSVISTRLIARETVEERVLQLQERKRALADAIIGEDNRLIAGIKRDELELLLS